MIQILSIQCIYIGQKSGKKTNRCQNVKVENRFKILLKTMWYVLNLHCQKDKKIRETKTKREKKNTGRRET